MKVQMHRGVADLYFIGGVLVGIFFLYKALGFWGFIGLAGTLTLACATVNQYLPGRPRAVIDPPPDLPPLPANGKPAPILRRPKRRA